MLTLEKKIVIATNEAIEARENEQLAINSGNELVIEKAIQLTETAETSLLVLEEMYGTMW